MVTTGAPLPWERARTGNYNLMRVTRIQDGPPLVDAVRAGIKIAIETHGPYTATPDSTSTRLDGPDRAPPRDINSRHRQQIPQRERSATEWPRGNRLAVTDTCTAIGHFDPE